MSEENPSDKNQNQTDQRLEAVKELLFGQNVQEYREEFKEIRDQIKVHEKKLNDTNADLNTAIADRIDNLESKLNTQLSTLNKLVEEGLKKLNDEKVDKKSLASLFTDIAKKLD